jgi:pyruvate,water dikinase
VLLPFLQQNSYVSLQGQVLVTEMTDPDWVPAMKIASAVVTNRGGRTCHAAIISREMGIPCVVGTGDCTFKVNTGDMVTVDASRGEIGVVLPGKLGCGGATQHVCSPLASLFSFRIKETDMGTIPETKTKIMMNLANPEQGTARQQRIYHRPILAAFEKSFLTNSGIGLARMEFIVNNHIKAHPLACLFPEKLV